MQDKIDQHLEEFTQLKYLSYDERKDNTLFPKGRVGKEAHLTMVGDHGEYLNHGSFGPDEKKTGKNICQKVYNTLEETDSLRSLLFLAADGTAANSGINSKFCMNLVLPIKALCSKNFQNVKFA